MGVFSILLCLSTSLKGESNIKFIHFSPYMYSVSNLSFNILHSGSMKNLINSYSNHPIFIGLPKHANIELSISNIHLDQAMIAPLLHGRFSQLHLNSLHFSKNNFGSLIQVDNSEIIEINDTINFQKNGFLDVFFDSIVTITNCYFSQFISTGMHNSIIQSYGANVTINRCSFYQSSSNTSPILFSAVSDIQISYSNFSSNLAESEGVFSMTRTNGFSDHCLYYDNIATENGVCSISNSRFHFTHNSFFHNKAEKNSIVYFMTSNSTLEDNFFVANRLHAVFYGIVSIYDDTKVSSNITFLHSVFSLNKNIDEYYDNSKMTQDQANIHQLNKKAKSGSHHSRKIESQLSVYSIYYRGDETVLLDHCIFDTDYSDSLISFDGGSFTNADSKFDQQITTPYDSYDEVQFSDFTDFSLNFNSTKSTVIFVLFVFIFSLLMTFISYFLWKISRDVQPS